MPLFVQTAGTPSVSAHSLTRNGQPIDHCLFDGTSYVNPDPNQQSLGRAVLSARNAIVIMPRARLQPGTYDASVASGTATISWAFQVTCAQAAPAF
jgi:hypothetical protein